MTGLGFHNCARLAERFGVVKDVFGDMRVRVVGGAVRDILLDAQTPLDDIDLTCAGEPDAIWPLIDTAWYACFRTQKYGTMTMIVKQTTDDTASESSTNESELLKISYELTPFRTESDYTDSRHPDAVTRSQSLVADAARRDFTINALYYTHMPAVSLAFGTAVCHEMAKDISTTIQHHVSQYTKQCQVACDEKSDDDQSEKKNTSRDQDSGVIVCFALESGDVICYVHGAWCDQLSLLSDDDMVRWLADRERAVQWYGVPPQWSYAMHVIVDPYAGLGDLLDKKISCVGDPDVRFCEDALRIVRALRFVNILNQRVVTPVTDEVLDPPVFDLTTPTWLSLRKHYYLVRDVAHQRIRDEVIKVFRANNPSWFVAMLDVVNLLDYIFPAVAATKNVAQPVRYHTFDVYAHTMLTLYHIQAINPDWRVKLAMLYHDVGKPEQYYYTSILTTDEDRKSVAASRLNHPVSGASLLEQDCRRLGIAVRDIDQMKTYVRQHMAPGMVMQWSRKSITKKLRKWISERWVQMTHNLLDITIADRLGQINPVQLPHIEGVTKMHEIVDEIVENEWRFTTRDLAIDGRVVMEECGIAPWPRVGEILQRVFDRVLQDHTTRNNRDQIMNYIRDITA